MSNFLLFVSLVLNGIVILALINLYLRQNRLTEVEKRVNQSFEEIESVISSYLFEMKEENEQFIKRFKKFVEKNELTKNKTSKINDNLTVDKNLEKNSENFNVDDSVIPRIEHTSRLQAISSYQKNNQTTKEKLNISEENISENKTKANDEKLEEIVKQPITTYDKNNADQLENKFDKLQKASIKEEPLVEQIQKLQQKGYSTDAIAKKLHKGKTEIELMIKLQQN